MAQRVPPRVKDSRSNAQLDATYGGVNDQPNIYVQCSRAFKRLKVANVQLELGTISETEHGQQVGFCTAASIAAMPRGGGDYLDLGPNAPQCAHIFAANMNRRLEASISRLEANMDRLEANMNRRFDNVDRRLDNVDRRLDNVDRRLDNMDRRFDNMDRRFDNREARLLNAAVFDYSTTLKALRNHNNEIFPEFPQNLQALMNLTNDQVGEMLEFYGVNRNPSATREGRLKKFLGIRS